MEKSENFGEISEKIGNYREKSEKVWKNWTNEISVHFSFRGSPKNDISAKYRPKKPKFLSMSGTHMSPFSFPSRSVSAPKKIISSRFQFHLS